MYGRSQMIACPECKTENYENYRYCCCCGKELLRYCPVCGVANTLQFQFCGECGSSLLRLKGADIKENPFLDKVLIAQKGLPDGLTEKVLLHRGEIEGQRKLVTVVRCDIEGYFPISARLGSERVQPIMEEIFDIFFRNVHEYGGTVNDLTYGGITAFFGTPITIDNAPQRAVRSALAIHRDMAALSPKLKGQYAIRPMKVCIGINTGPLVVRKIQDNLRIEFTPVGDTMNIAEGIRNLAEPGTTYLTEETYTYVERQFRFEEIGERNLNGAEAAVKVFRVITPGTKRAIFSVDGEKGLRPFVGRERELEMSMDAEDYKTGCREDMTLKELDKKPKSFKGMKVTYQGEIMRKMEYDGVTDILLDVSKDERSGDDSIFLWYDGITSALENDVVQVWGEVKGSYSYTSAAGWKITLPLVRSQYIEVIQPMKVGT
jgi:class 3 adenylate cyclase